MKHASHTPLPQSGQTNRLDHPGDGDAKKVVNNVIALTGEQNNPNAPSAAQKNQRPSRPIQTKLSEPLHTLYNTIREPIADLLAAVFDSTDDTLFQMSKNVSAEDAQTIYFDGLRTIRLHRQNLIKKYNVKFYGLFHALSQQRLVSETDTDVDTWSLVSEDDMEVEVAMQNMASRTVKLCKIDLLHLESRLQALAPGYELTHQNMPLNPISMCTIFDATIAPVNLDQKIKLVLLKAFEHTFLTHLSPILACANDTLCTLGILPTLNLNEKPKAPNASTARDNPNATTACSTDTGHQGSPELEGLAGLLREMQLAMLKQCLPDLEQVHSGHNDGCQTKSQALATPTATSSGEIYDLAPLLHAKLQTSAATMGGAAGASNQSVLVDTITAMFNTVLDNPAIPRFIRYSLWRLQIPFLKLAMLDNQFLTSNTHPARILLNLMAQAAATINDQDARDPLITEIDKTVNDILEDYEEDTEFFATLKARFEKALAQQKQHSTVLAQRLRIAEEGKQRHAQAQCFANSVITQATASLTLAEPLSNLFDHWFKQHLIITVLRSEEDAIAVKDFIADIRLIAWSLIPEKTAQERSTLLNAIPRFLPKLRAHLVECQCPNSEMQTIFSQIDDIHQTIIRQPINKDQHNNPLVMSAEKGLIDHRNTAELVRAEPCEEQTRCQLNDSSEPSANHPTTQAALTRQTPAAEPITLCEGDWVDLSLPEKSAASGRPQQGKTRARLSLYFQQSDKIIFTSRMGLKILECSSAELNQMITQGRCDTVDHEDLFEHALTHVISDLQRRRQTKALQASA